ncbi:MAG: ATP-binding protein [Planctomycetota bacterium]|jgi:SpoVK/Ycf46/Vps4 family AAA+-type ATPase
MDDLFLQPKIKTLEAHEASARKAEEAGDAEAAASHYNKASFLALEIAEKGDTRAWEDGYKKRARRNRERAQGILSGARPVGPRARAATRPTSEVRSDKKKKSKEKGDAEEIQRVVDGLRQTAKVGWNDIGGLEGVKQEIKFALGIWLARPPSRSDGVAVELQSWRNMLFYGPPGTGKTLLAAATSRALKTRAEEQGAVFFNVKVSSVLSKYFGESTKIISELYGMARDQSPAVIFLDEFEALAGSRDEGTDTGPERRILSTILAELDGLAEKGRTDIYVLTIAATNRPWDLDAAVLSRFDKKILIPLPDATTRRKILEILIDRKGLESRVPHEELVAMTEGFSGREIERFCKEAQNRMVQQMNTNIPALVDQGLEKIRNHTIKVRPLTAEDFQDSATRINPQTTLEEDEKYRRWRDEQS